MTEKKLGELKCFAQMRAQIWEQKPVLQQSRQTFCTVDPSTKKMTKYNMYRFKGLAGRKVFQPRGF